MYIQAHTSSEQNSASRPQIGFGAVRLYHKRHEEAFSRLDNEAQQTGDQGTDWVQTCVQRHLI